MRIRTAPSTDHPEPHGFGLLYAAIDGNFYRRDDELSRMFRLYLEHIGCGGRNPAVDRPVFTALSHGKESESGNFRHNGLPCLLSRDLNA